MYYSSVYFVASVAQMLTFCAAIPITATDGTDTLNSTISLNSTIGATKNPRVGTLECYPGASATQGLLKKDCINALLGFDQGDEEFSISKNSHPSVNEFGRCSLSAGYYPLEGTGDILGDVTTPAFLYQGFMMIFDGCQTEGGRVDAGTIRIGKEGNILLHVQKLPKPDVRDELWTEGNVTAITTS